MISDQKMLNDCTRSWHAKIENVEHHGKALIHLPKRAAQVTRSVSEEIGCENILASSLTRRVTWSNTSSTPYGKVTVPSELPTEPKFCCGDAIDSVPVPVLLRSKLKPPAVT